MSFTSAILFWLAPVALALIGVAVFALVLILYGAAIAYQQWRCKHGHWYENMACDAMCSDCGKNLGFIGNWRKQPKDPS